jgi:hypothetical protein
MKQIENFSRNNISTQVVKERYGPDYRLFDNMV